MQSRQKNLIKLREMLITYFCLLPLENQSQQNVNFIKEWKKLAKRRKVFTFSRKL
jgi:hypothetical protein